MSFCDICGKGIKGKGQTLELIDKDDLWKLQEDNNRRSQEIVVLQSNLTAAQEENRALRERLEEGERLLHKVPHALAAEMEGLDKEIDDYLKPPTPPTSTPEPGELCPVGCSSCGNLYSTTCTERLKAETLGMVLVRHEALPDPNKLLILADWFDSKYPPYNIGSMEVQNDLRKWAKRIKAALEAAKEET
jgi:DNA repair exonuclease SbcCD ATPase subunit